MQSAILVVVDRLGAGFLGPYGNTWLDTPEFNRLAAESFLCEQAMIDSPRLDVVYRSYWQGRHAMCGGDEALPSLPKLLKAGGMSTTLLTDEPAVAAHPLAAGFAEHVVLDNLDLGRPAEEPEQTGTWQLLAAACDWLTTSRRPFLLWVHARGMSGPWDAPREFRERFSDAEDPEAPDFVNPPDVRLPANFDPDEAWGIIRAYAGQVALLDLGLGMLQSAIAESPLAEQTLLGLTSSRGFPLGEHQRIGTADEALYGELLHVPLLVRLPEVAAALSRTQALVQPADLFATLSEWFRLPFDPREVWGRSILPIIHGSKTKLRDRACTVADRERAIRTPAWLMRQSDSKCELYAKPDDRWEVNEVANRCGDVAEELVSALDQFEQAAQSTPFSDPPPLAAVLAEGLS